MQCYKALGSADSVQTLASESQRQLLTRFEKTYAQIQFFTFSDD